LGENSILGQPLESLIERAPQVVETCRDCLADRVRIAHREVWIRADGERIPVRLSVVPLAESPDEGDGIVATLTDLRPLRAMEEELRRLDRLAALGRFAAAVAHEIRNPLAAIGAGVEFLGSALGPEKASDLTMLRTEIARLDRIVSDLLEPVRTHPLMLEKVAIADLMRHTCDTVAPHALKHNVRLQVHPSARDEQRPMKAEVDRDRLLQVLINLVRNAIEASPEEGKVEIGWGREEGPDSRIRICVRDEGCGIEPDELEHIFEPFYSTKSNGTGLGLYVSNCIVEQHGGKLQVESLPEGGVRATVYLPLPPE
jgi:two-component system sensor histidine kinase HydH